MRNIGIRRQWFATLSVNLITFTFGWNCSWSNANFLELQKPNVLPSGPLTYDEASFVVSIVCIGGLLGNASYLWVVERFGRKKPILLLALPASISWLLIIFAKNAYWLYAARFISGLLGGAGIIAIPIFVSEICSDSVRGQMSAAVLVANSLGMLTGFIVAIFSDYRQQAFYASFIQIIFLFAFYFVPETPVYLRKSGQNQLADLSLEFYKGIKVLPEEKSFVNEKKTDETQNGLSFNDFFGTRSLRKALLICIFLTYFVQFSGVYILLNYTTAFFAEAGSELTPLQSSILICVVQLVANAFAAILVDRLGRRILLVTSTIGTALGMLVLSLHRFYREELPDTNWVPMYALSFTIFIASIGLLPTAYILPVDVLPAKIRNAAMTFCSINMWVLGFGTNIAYLYLLQVIKLHGCLMVFSCSCFIVAIFALIVIPETKGKSPESVRELLAK